MILVKLKKEICEWYKLWFHLILLHTSHNNTSFDKWRLKKKVKSNERTIVFLRYLDISALYCMYWSPFKIEISGRTSNPKCEIGHWSKMTLKSSSYLLTKLQNQLTKNGHNFSKKCFKRFKNWSFQKNKTKFIEEIQFSGTFFVIDIFWKLKALFTKIVPIFCQLILEFC